MHSGSPGFLRREQALVDETLRRLTAASLVRVAPVLRDPIDYALSTTGKRLRPVLCVAAYAAVSRADDVPEPLYRAACSLEIVHTYSLVHDDLPCMDDDDLRRGRPTLHRAFGRAKATVAGAAMLPLAVSVLDTAAGDLGLHVEERANLVGELTRAAGAAGMVGGQLADLEGESRTIDGVELERIHRRKTGALLTASLRIGAIAARASADLLDSLTTYGEYLGLAFQITDDLLDVEGSSADLGKTAGRDSELHKASYPALYGNARAREMAAECARSAKEALRGEGLADLVALAEYVVERRN